MWPFPPANKTHALKNGVVVARFGYTTALIKQYLAIVDISHQEELV